ncbi:hypothetical protein [Staphylococcus pasteuri]|uniref:hypothetical protein n=1 Tax=Staphylococcus pasteuri TaxID=45972 RepID=UPI0032617B68
MKNNSCKANLMTYFAALLYVLSGGLTGVLYGSNFATVMLPITVYMFFGLSITHLLKNGEEKRLNDLNNISLLSYGISYILYKPLDYCISNPFIAFFIFLSLLLLFILLFMILLGKNTKKEWWK